MVVAQPARVAINSRDFILLSMTDQFRGITLPGVIQGFHVLNHSI
jgi:hypothetical protein